MGKYKPYSIRMPAFDLTSGGIRVCWGLYGWLLAKGQIVYPNAKYNDSNFVAVYPEIYHGNDTGANTVVRYVLNKPGFMSTNGVPGPQSFGPDDKIYVFSKIYDTIGVDDDHLMFLPILNTNLFKAKKGKRKNKCVFVGKGIDLDLPETKGLTRITREMATNQGDLADYLNTCEVMYSFENPTAMNEIARLAGCKVCYIPEGAMTEYSREELETRYEPGMEGIFFGIDEYKNSTEKFDSDSFREHYLELIKVFEKKLDIFIEETQK